MPKSKLKTRRTFTREFKVQAVQLVTEKGDSYAEAARQLGITDAQLRNWKKPCDADSAKAFPGNGRRAVQDEVQSLRVENKRLLLERDILKKAAAFFARECL